MDILLKAGIRILPAKTSFALTKAVTAPRSRAEMLPVEKEAMRLGQPIKLGRMGHIPAVMWGQGPTVALVHGWGGRAAQMAPLAVHLAELGFRSVAFDVTGHGTSNQSEARWEWFLRDIAEVAEAFDPLFGFVGHSAGALAMMAARDLKGVRADRFVCASAPLFPYPPLRMIQQRFNANKAVLGRYEDYLASQFQTNWASLKAGSAWKGAGENLLLCYDTKDRFIDPTDGERIKALCPGATLFKTHQYGHTRMMSVMEVTGSIGLYLKGMDNAGAESISKCNTQPVRCSDGQALRTTHR